MQTGEQSLSAFQLGPRLLLEGRRHEMGWTLRGPIGSRCGIGDLLDDDGFRDGGGHVGAELCWRKDLRSYERAVEIKAGGVVQRLIDRSASGAVVELQALSLLTTRTRVRRMRIRQ